MAEWIRTSRIIRRNCARGSYGKPNISEFLLKNQKNILQSAFEEAAMSGGVGSVSQLKMLNRTEGL